MIIDSEKECPSNCPVDSEKNETGERVRGQGYRCKFKLIYRLTVTKNHNAQFCKNTQIKKTLRYEENVFASFQLDFFL